MDAAVYLKNAEKCEGYAKACEDGLSRAFFLDAAAHWRQMAPRGESGEKQPPRRLPARRVRSLAERGV
jgi:hypothetical protein